MRTAALFLLCLGLVSNALADLPRLRTAGQTIVNQNGNRVALKGVNLGNWLLIEPGVFPEDRGLPDAFTLKQIFTERFGDEGREKLMRLWHEHFITAADFDRIKAFGFNFVRLGFEYDVLEASPMKLRDDAFEFLDFAINECEQRGIYVLIDMHGAPRRQSDGKPTGQRGVNRFFFEPEAQDRAMFIWEQIAERYKGRPAVLGYEALNEPWGGGKDRLREFVERWYACMREIDPEAILVFPGWTNDIRFYGNPKEKGYTNVMFDMHFYPGYFGWGHPEPAVHEDFLNNRLRGWKQYMAEIDTPLLIGEFNVVEDRAGGAAMMKRYFDLADELGWPMCAWTIKEYKSAGGIGDKSWGLTTNRHPMPTPNWREDSYESIAEWIRNLPNVEIEMNEPLRKLLTEPQP